MPTLPALPAGLPPVVRSEPLSGGSIAAVWRAVLRDGREVVVKEGTTPAELEAEGLEALRAAGGPVPAVLASAGTVLVLEHLDGPRGDRRDLGRSLARVHRTIDRSFGWHRDNVIGPLPQPNPRTRSWPSFLAEARLLPHLDVLPGASADRLQRAIDTGVVADLAEHGAPASLVHGDLWSGNVHLDRWLLDPAVHHADREIDLAMLELFGSVGPAMHEGYHEVWPLDEGWERRQPLLQLPPLLVHVRLFGASYHHAVAARLDALGW
ncbi:MAG: fructosamine kinase family protein [Nitriliruptoraceae bacterium]